MTEPAVVAAGIPEGVAPSRLEIRQCPEHGRRCEHWQAVWALGFKKYVAEIQYASRARNMVVMRPVQRPHSCSVGRPGGLCA